MPVFRNLWQPGTPPRHAPYSSIDVEVGDYDPTVRGPLVANPYQLRWRDSTYKLIGANQQWLRKRLSTNELGLADGDPNVKPPWADGSAYLWKAPYQPPAITAMQQWNRKRLSTNELGDTNADATIKPVYQDPWQRRRTDPARWAVQSWEQWFRKTLNSNDLGTIDADPTVKPVAEPYPYQLYNRVYWYRFPPQKSDQSEPAPIITPPAPEVVQVGGKSLGRRGPWYPDRTPELVLREEEEILWII